MSSLVIERLDVPSSARDEHALGAAQARVGDVLAGRTVWCASAQPGAFESASALRSRIDAAGPGVATSALHVVCEERLRRLAERLDGMLARSAPSASGFGQAERDLYAEGTLDSEELVGDDVRADDVVVAHDALSAILAQAARERGAHAVWRVRVAGASPTRARQALEFLRSLTSDIDAYVLTWRERSPRGEAVEIVAVAMPSRRVVAATEFPLPFGGADGRGLAWRMAVAEAVRSDRDESVGGTLHPRPAVAAR